MATMNDSTIYIGWLIDYCITVILGLLLLISTTCYLSKSSSSSSKHDGKQVVLPSIKRLSISYFVCYIFAFLFLICELCLKLSTSNEDVLDDQEDILWGIAFFFGGCGNLVYYILLIIRLYFTFQDTIYQTNKYLFYCYIVGIILFVVFGFCYISSVLSESNEILRVIFLFIAGSINILIRLSLIATFSYKLCLLIAQTNATSIIPTTSSSSSPRHSSSTTRTSNISSFDNNDSSSYQQFDLFKTMTKQLLLGIIAISTNTIAVILVGIERLIRNQQNLKQDFGTMTFIIIILLVISIWIEMICAYLGFNFNENLYYKICGKCHNECCMTITDRSVTKMSSKIQERNSMPTIKEVVK